ncbi:MAG: BolA family transcriptional regulator [Leptospiraceae bacterium]|nr:BolA family transcriptional regulator [Leptospiraceae bacterium]
MAAEAIAEYLHRAFPDAEVELTDLAGDSDHFAVTVRSAAFSGKSRVQQHKMVYAALEGHVGDTLHALAVKTEAK